MATPDGRTTSRHPVYAISVAAELTGSGVQSLRLYERIGLVEPARTPGGTRRYSEADLERVRRIVDLLAEGVNLAGIGRILHLEMENERLRERVADSERRGRGPAPAPPVRP